MLCLLWQNDLREFLTIGLLLQQTFVQNLVRIPEAMGSSRVQDSQALHSLRRQLNARRVLREYMLLAVAAGSLETA